MGDEKEEKVQAKRAEARREAKKLKKSKVDPHNAQATAGKGGPSSAKATAGKGGERVALVEGTELKPEFKKLVEEVEKEAGSKNQELRERKQEKQKIRSKKYLEASMLVDRNKLYSLVEAIELVKKTSLTKFDGTVELHLNLKPEILGDKNDKKDFRGSVNLPHGTGKQVKVVIADEAVIAEIEGGKFNFDILVSHPSMMPKLAKVARVLGPKGLMPNPKNGTVTDNPEKRAKELGSGSVNFKTEPGNPILHLAVGKVSFTDKQLSENVTAVMETVNKNKILKATITSSMGPGIKVAVS